jgi:hypothetical protein
MRHFIQRFRGLALGATGIVAILLFPEVVMAQAGGTNDALKNFAEIASTLVQFISGAAMMMMQFFPPLWGSELITGVQVTEMLRPMWIYIRNVTNIAFVGMLLFVALINLVTMGKGINEWNIKSKLPKIILGLVAINFSMLMVRVAVDMVHVGTVALLSIADPVIDARGIDNVADYYSRKIDTETFEPCDSGANCKTVRNIVNLTFCTSEEACLFKIKEISALQADAALMGNPERRNIMLAFGTFFMKLESLPLLSADTGGLLDVLNSALFSLVFGLAYLLALLAMMIVLIIRVVMMWLFTIFSPVIVMVLVMGIPLPFLTTNFRQYLLLPLKAAGALAFGFVMISQLELMTIPNEFYVSVIEPGPSLRALWGPDEFGGWRMLWKILTVVLFWKVVFDFALKDIEGASGIVNGIKGFGEKAGSFALTTVADQVPIGVPGTSSQGTTLASLFGPGSINNRIAQATQTMRTTDGAQGPIASFRGQGEALAGRAKANEVFGSGARDLPALRSEIEAQRLSTRELTAAMQDDAIRRNVLTTATGLGYRGGQTGSAEDIRQIVAFLDDQPGVEFTDTGRDGARGDEDGDAAPAVTVGRVEGDTNRFNVNIEGAEAPIDVNGADAAARTNMLATELASMDGMTNDRVQAIARAIAAENPDYLGDPDAAENALLSAYLGAR